jgi:hypothetical protein
MRGCERYIVLDHVARLQRHVPRDAGAEVLARPRDTGPGHCLIAGLARGPPAFWRSPVCPIFLALRGLLGTRVAEVS